MLLIEVVEVVNFEDVVGVEIVFEELVEVTDFEVLIKELVEMKE